VENNLPGSGASAWFGDTETLVRADMMLRSRRRRGVVQNSVHVLLGLSAF
jgi:hypothetical protein